MNIILNGNIITVTTDKSWYCFVNGNFALSKYSGYGNDTITIIVPSNIAQIYGYVEFVDDNTYCPSKYVVNVNYSQQVTTELNATSPIEFESKGESSAVTVTSSSSWWIVNENDVKDKITISDIGENSFTITSNVNYDYTCSVILKNADGLQATVQVIQKKKIDSGCTISISSVTNGEYFYITIDSKKDGNFNPYTLEIPTNTEIISNDNIGNVVLHVIDNSKEVNGNVTATNNCGNNASTNIGFQPSEKKTDKFVINDGGDDGCTKATITFVSGNTSYGYCDNIQFKFNEDNCLPIISTDSNGNDVNWYPQSYDTDKFTLSYSQEELCITLNDYTASEGVIRLINDNGKSIVINYIVEDELVEEDRVYFCLNSIDDCNSGDTNDCCKEITIDYDENGNEVTVFSYLQTSGGTKENLSWKCISTDSLLNYTVEPMESNGSSDGETVKITLSDVNKNKLNDLESDYVGTVVLQQPYGHDKLKINISHKKKEKVWCDSEAELTDVHVSPSVTEVEPCGNEQSEEIIVVGTYELAQVYKVDGTCDDENATVYDTRTTVEERPINDVTWTSNQTDITIHKGNNDGGYYFTATPNTFGNNPRKAVFTGTSGNLQVTVQVTQDAITVGEGTVESAKRVDSVNFDVSKQYVPNSGETIDIVELNAILTSTIQNVDSCGNPIGGAEQEGDVEIVTNGVTLHGCGANWIHDDVNNMKITIDENEKRYTFDYSPNGCIEFTGSTYVFEWVDTTRSSTAIDDDTENNLTSYKTINSYKEGGGERSCEYYAEYQGVRSSTVTITQGRGESSEREDVEYTLVSKPNWVTVEVDGTQLVVTAMENTETDERSGNIVLKQNESGKELTICVTQDGKDVIRIPDFDYLTLRYYWNADNGRDLDTGTMFVNTGINDLDGKPVGWAMGSYSRDEILFHGGDNTQSGNEAAYVNFFSLLDAHFDTLPQNVEIEVYGNWYGSKSDGNIQVEITAYKGGTMTKDGYNFVNEGGEEVYSSIEDTNVYAWAKGTPNTLGTCYFTNRYSHIATITYNKDTRAATMRIYNGQSGLDLRGSSCSESGTTETT